MKKIWLLFFISPYLTTLSQSQNNKFILKGKIWGSLDGAKIYLTSGFIDKNAMDWALEGDSSTIYNSEFFFRGTIKYPHAVRLIYKDSTQQVISELFFIDAEEQVLNARLDSINFKTPIVLGSKTNQEYIKNYHPLEFDSQFTELLMEEENLSKNYKGNIPESEIEILKTKGNHIVKEKDSILLSAATNKQSHFISLWLATEYLQTHGYKPLYYTVCYLISPYIKNTKTGKYLIHMLTGSRLTSIGEIFPFLDLLNSDKKRVYTNFANDSYQYIFIDFWFSHCFPCIREFDALSKIYSNYSRKGLQVIGISVDDKKDEAAWRKAIIKYRLNWPQYWTIDHKESSRLLINNFPSNFLLNKSGKIIAKNIDPLQLQSFLQNNLKLIK